MAIMRHSCGVKRVIKLGTVILSYSHQWISLGHLGKCHSVKNEVIL